MPDQTVRVTFNPDASPQFTFDKSQVQMTSAGKVILEKNPETAPWTFKHAHVKKDVLKEFSSKVLGDGRFVHIDDAFHDKTKTPYSYDVTVDLDHHEYTSPDPEIVNDPGSVET